MTRVPLRRRDGTVRAYALLDAEDFARFGHLRWSAHSRGYAYRWERQADGSRHCLLLHRAVMGLERGDVREVDHENRCRLDCRRENLRIVPPGANAQNIGRKVTRFRGVYPTGKRWYAKVEHAGKQYHVGTFDDEVVAARAAEAKRAELLPYALPDPELARLAA